MRGAVLLAAASLALLAAGCGSSSEAATPESPLGLRLVTLTNSAPAAVQQQLANAGLNAFFERSFSVDPVRRFKPAPEAYRSVADALGVPVDQLRLVAAHAWDIVGALRAGCAAAFVARPGKVLYPLGPQPDIVGPNLRQVAQAIVAAERA